MEAEFWGPQARQQRDADVEFLITKRARSLDLPPELRLLAFVWDTDPGSIDNRACATLPTFGDLATDRPTGAATRPEVDRL
jgi:hypothetical protein